jgi:streptomycin 6-kinase
VRHSARGSAWLDALPRLLVDCVERWGLALGMPFPDAYVSFTIAATLPDGSDVVLKVQFPDRESEHEAEALARWDGDAAIRLLAHDACRHALLLERCVPGTPLSALGQDHALDVLVAALFRLWKPASAPFRPLGEEAAWWAGYLPGTWERHGRPFPRRLLDAALDALRTLPARQGEHVLLHQDLHAGNVLRAEREPWLAIDPKPIVAERAYDTVAIVRDARPTRDELRRRLDALSELLGLDRERMRLWGLVKTLAWDDPREAELYAQVGSR